MGFILISKYIEIRKKYYVIWNENYIMYARPSLLFKAFTNTKTA
jgi:hypothetical protein